HKEFLETRGEGLHHLGFFVTDLDNQINNLTRQGFQVTQGGKRLTGGGFAYFDTDKVGGVVLELVQR
ncbi:MAG: VOC family protein, partial [Chloroflexi bacterium]|nr:VOC family protein [Chloroflexota bacterium]